MFFSIQSIPQTIMSVIYFPILALQMTDVELDERVTALEENGGGGNSFNG